jgi:hypothetical protein
MPLIDYNARTVHLRFAVLGPRGAGKRTVVRRLQALSGARELEERAVGAMERVGFSFEPAKVEALEGHRLVVEIFALGGEVAPGPLAERMLSDLDAVLVVADSRPEALEGNGAWLREMGAMLAEVPVVLFYNRRDMAVCTAIAEMEKALNGPGARSFGGSALTGAGLEPLLGALVEVAFAARR